METHKHIWKLDNVNIGTQLGYTVTVWWECACGAGTTHSHTFRPPSVEPERLQTESQPTVANCTCGLPGRHDATFGHLLA